MNGYLSQTNFTGGIFSPLMEGRTDFEKYANAVKRGENFIIWPHGPAQLRPGTKYIATVKDSSDTTILLPFEFSVTQAYIIEAGDQYFRFYKDQAQITSGGLPYEISNDYVTADIDEVKYTQSADVLYLFHGDYPTAKLTRTGHTAWTIADINWKPGAMTVQAIQPAATLTLSAVTGSGITVTAGAAVFQTGDVGRQIESGIGLLSITGFTSTTVLTADVIDDFSSVGPIASGSWDLKGSPNGSLLPDIQEPVGAICTLTASEDEAALADILTAMLDGTNKWIASGSGTNEYYYNVALAAKPSSVRIDGTTIIEGSVGTLGISQWDYGDNDAIGGDRVYIRLSDGADPDSKYATEGANYIQYVDSTTSKDLFRSTDVGKFVLIHGGVVKINTYTSATQVSGEILKELSSTDASLSWTLESETWNATNGYPSCGTFFEDRLTVAGSPEFPETVWGSVVGDYENHTPGVDDSDAYQFSLAGRKVNVIRWIEPREYLMLGTVGTVFRLGPEDTGDPLTPLNVVAKDIKVPGVQDLLPIDVPGATLYTQRHGKKIRELTYKFEIGESGGFVAPDLTLLAENLFKDSTIVSKAYQEEPIPMLWIALADGSLLSLTYLRDENIVAVMDHPMDNGLVKSLAVIPGTGYDELWMIVERTINGSTVKYVEMMEEIFKDSASTYASNSGLNAFFVDSGITYNGAATKTITGLDHLEGETVAVLADGAYAGTFVVSGGSITLNVAASIVHAGLPFTGTIQTLKPHADLADGTAQGRQAQVVDMIVRVKDSGPFKVGRDESNLDTIQDPEITQTLGGSYPLFTGDLRCNFEGQIDRDISIYIVQDKPMPLTLVSIYPETSIE